ncbi:hypothetical protein BDW74DRAFT_181095 [Aspergillus multicolor]|uniref:peptidase S41 family protein n=1 Tax=Aspergillus multicolor TaxID=41759 RepID=UPI003CCE524A
MARNPLIALLLSLSPALASTLRPPPSSITSASIPNPTACSTIVQELDTAVFDAKAVHDCLISVPFNPAVGSRLVNYINDTIQFQSTLAYLKNPPLGYRQPAVDLVAGLSQLQSDINDGVFDNEYVFETAVQRLLNAAHDDHLSLSGGILSPFGFQSPYAIASVSLDGIELPKVYVTDDLFANETDDVDWTPSAIATINGQDAVEYLTAFAALNSVGKLEPHAEWNMLMQSGALDAQGYYEVFWGSATFYPGESITFAFENGTSLGPSAWKGIYFSPGDTGPLQTGGDFYNFFVLGFYPASYDDALESFSQTTPNISAVLSSSMPSPSSSAVASETEVFDTAYPPTPDVMLSDPSYSEGLPQGYFLNGSSLAVITIPLFLSHGNNATAFTDTVRQFLTQSQQAGLKKVIIDLQQNKGGQALLAIETFRQFFPSIKPTAPSRRRAHPVADALGSTLTPYWQNLTNTSKFYRSLTTNEWVVANRLNAETHLHFTSWDDYYFSAAAYEGDTYTKLEEYNITDTTFIREAADTEANNNPGPQRYQADDMIILTDSLCSSACALFMELMHQQAGVRTVAVGGRPDTSPMQAASGTRGAAIYSANRLDQDIELAKQIDNLTTGLFPDRTNSLYSFVLNVNLQDQIRLGNVAATLLQLHYEAADCRIFYTPTTWYNYTKLWEYAFDAAWTNPKLCIVDSSSSSRQPHPPTPSQPPAQAQRQPSTSPKGTNTNTAGSAEHPLAQDPSNDILSALDAIAHYDLLQCNEHKDCNGGGHYSCEAISVCHNGVVTVQKRCVRSCQLLSRSCQIGTCIFPQSSSASAAAAATTDNIRTARLAPGQQGRGSRRGSRFSTNPTPSSPGKCIPVPPKWCSDPRYDRSLSPSVVRRKQAEFAASIKKDGFVACGNYEGLEICFTPANEPVYNPYLLAGGEDTTVRDPYGQF